MVYQLIHFDTLGIQEEQYHKRVSGRTDAESEQRRATHSLVTMFRCGKEPIRVEVIASSENFLNVSKVAIKRLYNDMLIHVFVCNSFIFLNYRLS